MEKTPNPRLQSEPSPPSPPTLVWALPGSGLRGVGGDSNLTHIFPVACYTWGPGEGLVVSLRGETLTGLGGGITA